MASAAPAPAPAPDAATAYADYVLGSSGHEHGQPIRDAAQRHMDDLAAGRHQWNPAALTRFETLVAGAWPVRVQGRPGRMELMGWQQFLVGSLLGWRVIDPDDPLGRPVGTRRYRYVTIMTAKGSGKSPLVAALSVYHLIFDGYYDAAGEWMPELHPNGYVLANTRDQATEVTMRPLAEAVEDSRELGRYLVVAGGSNPHSALCRDGTPTEGGRLRVIAQSGRGTSGPIISWLVGEEMQDWRSRHTWDALIRGFKSSPQPVAIVCANAGRGRIGPAWEEREAALIAARGDGSDQHLGLVYESDPALPRQKDPRGKRLWFPARQYWLQANPSLGSITPPGYVKSAIDAAKSDHVRAEVLRLNFSEWQGAPHTLMPWARWSAAEAPRPDWLDEPPAGTRLFLAGDLAPKSDMTAWAALWATPEGQAWVEVDHWMPELGVVDREEATEGYLRDWASDGYIHAQPGSTLDYRVVIQAVLARVQAAEAAGIPVVLAADPYNLDEFCRASGGELYVHKVSTDPREQRRAASQAAAGTYGIEPFPQGYRMNAAKDLWQNWAIDYLIDAALNGQLTIQPNPVLRWNLQGVHVAANEGGAKRLTRPHVDRRRYSIDGIQALTMAVGLWRRAELNPPEPLSPYENPDFSMYGDGSDPDYSRRGGAAAGDDARARYAAKYPRHGHRMYARRAWKGWRLPPELEERYGKYRGGEEPFPARVRVMAV